MLKTDDIHPPKTGISVHFSCSLESHFEVKQQKSVHIDPCTASHRLHLVLKESPIPRLVVPCMEAVLEDGRLDVVAFLPLVKGDGFDLASGLGLFYP